MPYLLLCCLVFIGTLCLNLTYISVFYHRGFTHKALSMRPWLRRWIQHSGVWMTGLDLKAWVCMHRAHHETSDTVDDPHSPANFGIFGTLLGQLRSYEKCVVGLTGQRKHYTQRVKDLDFPVHWLLRHRMWWVPYLMHALIAVGIAFFMQQPLLGFAYYAGISSHIIQGWLVNSLGHAMGYRNFDLPDNSRNNTLVAWTTFGEGYQNNHHRFPTSPRFSVRFWEIDFGYGCCVLLRWLGLISFNTPAKVLLPT